MEYDLFAQLSSGWLPLLFAQEEAAGGLGKTIGGFAITILGIGLGLFVVCRPGVRQPPKEAKKAAAKKG